MEEKEENIKILAPVAMEEDDDGDQVLRFQSIHSRLVDDLFLEFYRYLDFTCQRNNILGY